MTRLFRDFETFSELKLGKGGHGLGRYARHASTEPLLLAWAFDDGRVEQIEFEAPVRAFSTSRRQQWFADQLPDHYFDALEDFEVVKTAWNDQFEREIETHVLGLEPRLAQHQCSMALAMTLSLPGSLAKVGEILRLETDKKKLSRGDALVRKFCGTRKPTKNKPQTRETRDTAPEDWAEFCLYNRQDVVSERAIYRKIAKYDMPAHEWDAWRMDQEINAKGIPINRRRAEKAVAFAKEFVASEHTKVRKITGLENPNSTQQLLPWLQSRGYPFEDLKKGHVARALDSAKSSSHWLFPNLKDDSYAKVLASRAETSKSSVKKYNAILVALSDDDFLRFCFQFAGAQRTWRWAGRILQPQNLPRPPGALEKYQEVLARAIEELGSVEELVAMFRHAFPDHKHVAPLMSLLAAAIRPTVEAPDGYVFADVDLNAIENRVLGWLSDDHTILDVFKRDRDPYINFATYLFGGSYDELFAEYKAGDKTKRTWAKPGELGCGYQLSAGKTFENENTGEIEATGLLGYAWGMGIKLTEEMAERSVSVWRELHSITVSYWYEIERAAKKCVRTGDPQRANRIVFDCKGPFLRMRLPSGRHLHYLRPKLEMRRMPWGKMKEVITYEGLNNQNQWVRLQTGPGKITENCLAANTRVLTDRGVQAIVDVSTDCRVWDGEKWVEHSGVVFSGFQRTIECGGFRATADHRVWADGWVQAKDLGRGEAESSFSRSYRLPDSYADCGDLRRFNAEEFSVAGQVRLRGTYPDCSIGSEERQNQVLRLQSRALDFEGNENSRPLETPGLCGLEVYAGEVPEPKSLCLSELWGSGDNGLQPLGQLRELLGGHGFDLPERARYRQDQQRAGLLSAELPLGDAQSEQQKSSSESTDEHSCRANDCGGSVGALRHREDDAAVSPGQQLAQRASSGSAGLYEPVYDIVGCGPDKRFTILTDLGFAVVHNCDQAISRDVLVNGMRLARAEGLDIRLHVHDQVVPMVPEDRAEECLQILKQCLTSQPSWADGLPLAAGGHLSKVFIKD